MSTYYIELTKPRWPFLLAFVLVVVLWLFTA